MPEHGHVKHGDRAHAGRGEHAHGHGGHGPHGNPADLQSYIARQESPERAAWQKPDAVLGAIGVKRGQVVCDIGGGPGYWSLRLAKKVGSTGRVYAVDAEPLILDVLRERLGEAHVRNVTPVLGRDDDPLLPLACADVVLIVDTYHHVPDGPLFLRRLARSLRRGGRIVNVDFKKEETPVGPPIEHRVSREAFLADARRAGLGLVAEHRFLPYQYFVVLKPTRGR